ncbi:MAG: hypothetical protein A3I13_02595 [Gammaproteobacteria bacterium RIFCSPLOWO2_02_FULL_47_50]|nr:MAG: hypothetical protein A3I13_02595 [Gammaproteobacteria bacterium RIFCSPLOWO2_02_FULL_47_50]OGT87763.1 MAG: hypothetical protein A3G42_02635 [Gammaproteobacteria bacterium RIFCSPLOWO2_12_FULL_47_76]
MLIIDFYPPYALPHCEEAVAQKSQDVIFSSSEQEANMSGASARRTIRVAAGQGIGAVFFWVLFFRPYKEKYLAGKGEI